MVRNRFDNIEPERQEALFRAAAEEFAEKGYDAASVNRIVESSGMSKGALYYYFEDKADLFSTVMERALGRALEAIGGFSVEALTVETFWPALLELTQRSVAWARGNAWYVKLARSLYRLRARTGSVGPGSRVFDIGREWTRRMVERGQELGVVRTDIPLPLLVEITMAVGEACDRWFFDHFEDYGDAELQRLVLAQFDLTRHMLDARHERGTDE